MEGTLGAAFRRGTACEKDAATAAANAGNVATSLPLLAGTDEILSFVPNAYFTGKAAGGSSVIYVTPGDGL